MNDARIGKSRSGSSLGTHFIVAWYVHIEKARIWHMGGEMDLCEGDSEAHVSHMRVRQIDNGKSKYLPVYHHNRPPHTT